MAKHKQKATVFIAMTYRGWSRAATVEKAVALLRAAYGTFLKTHGYTVHEVDPRTQINPLGLGMIYPKGLPPKHVKTVEGSSVAGKTTKQITKAKPPTHQEQIMDVNSDVAH
jgi:hypothetical protein